MSEPCENLENCGFFKNYKGTTDAIIKSWIRLYCESREKSESCERKEIQGPFTR